MNGKSQKPLNSGPYRFRRRNFNLTINSKKSLLKLKRKIFVHEIFKPDLLAKGKI